MAAEIFTGEIKTIEANNENSLEVFKEKSNREKEESDEQLDTTQICLNQKVKNLLSKIKSKEELPITLAQLNAGNNSQILINEISHYCILCTVQKN